MRLLPTALPDTLLIEPALHVDSRGAFVETYRNALLREAGVEADFVVHAVSRSALGVLRGLHYQYASPQGKLVGVAHGCVLDVVLDVRPDSPAYGRWSATHLDGWGHHRLWIPPGFAHGYLVLSVEAVVVYACTTPHDPESQTGVRWDDLDLDIPWPDVGVPLDISERDRTLPWFRDPARPPPRLERT